MKLHIFLISIITVFSCVHTMQRQATNGSQRPLAGKAPASAPSTLRVFDVRRPHETKKPTRPSSALERVRNALAQEQSGWRSVDQTACLKKK